MLHWEAADGVDPCTRKVYGKYTVTGWTAMVSPLVSPIRLVIRIKVPDVENFVGNVGRKVASSF
jgi:hypothetical protein